MITNTSLEDGPVAWIHRLRWGTTVEQVTNPSDTIATVNRRGATVEVTFYNRTAPVHLAAEDDDLVDDVGDPGASRGSAGRAEVEREQTERREHQEEICRAAATKRAEACARLVAGDLPVELAAEILADTLLTDLCLLESYDPAITAARWCGADLAGEDNDDFAAAAAAAEDWIVAQLTAADSAIADLAHMLATRLPGTPR